MEVTDSNQQFIFLISERAFIALNELEVRVLAFFNEKSINKTTFDYGLLSITLKRLFLGPLFLTASSLVIHDRLSIGMPRLAMY